MTIIRPYDGRVQANALHIPLADKSVHMCVTSPPYWGLRSYQIPDSIFGGDPNCKHRFGQPRRRGGSSGAQGRVGSCRPGRSNLEAQKRQNDCLGSFCAKCHAWKGQLGLEPDPYLFIEHIVEIFREVRRVMHDDGTLWLNVGDSYATGAGKVGDHPGGGVQGARWSGDVDRVRDLRRGYRGDRLSNGRGDQPAEARKKTRAMRDGNHVGKHTAITATGPMTQPNRLPIEGLKPKDLVGIPWRVALALQADGWWWRSTIVWHKPSPMPGSQKDRPTSSWEPVFLFSKRRHYYYDSVAIMEPVTGNAHSRGNGTGPKTTEAGSGVANNLSMSTAITEIVLARNRRDVWTIASEPLNEKHYAAFPQNLVEPCILAGTSAHGCCADCGAPYKRLIEKQLSGDMTPANGQGLRDQGVRRTSAESKAKWRALEKQARDAGTDHDHPFLPPRTIGWKKTCRCATGEKTKAIVFDPFAGSGTTLRVAERLDRRWVGLDLGYQDMQKRRLRGIQKPIPGLMPV